MKKDLTDRIISYINFAAQIIAFSLALYCVHETNISCTMHVIVTAFTGRMFFSPSFKVKLPITEIATCGFVTEHVKL